MVSNHGWHGRTDRRMQRMKKNLFIASILMLVFLLSGALVSCAIGLGTAVDMEAPAVSITSHRDNDSVAETFIIRGTASDNVGVDGITIDLPDAGIYYKIAMGGQWYKKTHAADWTAVPSDSYNYCTGEAASLSWSVAVDTSDRNPAKTDKSYTFTVTATDRMQNSGRRSKAECTVKLDTASPAVSVYKPELKTGSYADIVTESASYKLQDGNYLSRLMNGTLVLYGRQAQALTSKELLIEFDDGQLQSGLRKSTADSSTAVTSVEEVKVLPDAQFAGDGSPTVYYSKKLTGDQLSEWTITVTPEEWASKVAPGKQIIRVVSTSLSGSNGWERKILGYFVWWPDADIPWITASSGDVDIKETGIYECYQNSSISGNAYDDDGIKSIVSVISKYDESTREYVPRAPVTHQLPVSGDGSAFTYAAWSATVPAENGRFKIEATVKDIYGTESSVIRYFKTADVSAPRITISAPADSDFAIDDATGSITFTGNATDDVGITELALVWLNPKNSADPNNKIAYMTGNAQKWSTATAAGFTDDAGNKVYLLYKGENGAKQQNFTINKTFNVFTDFGIGTNDTYLTAQDFIFRVSDGQSATIKSITLTGDTDTPTLAFNDITIGANTQSFASGNIPTYPAMSNVTATVTGTWSDTFTGTVRNTDKVYAIDLSWGTGAAKKTATAVPQADGTWKTVISAPPSGGTLTATIKDYGGNTKTVQAAASIETAAWRLSRIDCQNDDGTYKAGDTLLITLEFTKNTDVTGTPSLTLNNGGTAAYKSGSGTASHVFEYVVGSGTAAEKTKLSVTAINGNGAAWGDSALKGMETVSSLTLPQSANLSDTRIIRIDNTPPRITSVTALSADGYYKDGASLLFKVEFSEDVTITNSNDMKVTFENGLSTASTIVSGSKMAILTYESAAGDNASPLTFKEITGGTASITDTAGNALSDWSPVTAPSFSGIHIDTDKPASPTYDNNWNPDTVIIDGAGTSFTLSGIETGATAEYSLDGGSNWIGYENTVSLTNNGTYLVTARQTDRAGNVSDNADIKTFTIDKGELLTKITASTVNGTYSTHTATKTITGRIEFRRNVTIAQGATVTLNVTGSDGNFKTCPVNECAATDGSGTSFTFTYTIAEGDAVSSASGSIDVISWDMAVTVGGQQVTVAVPQSGQGKRFSENRNIKIQTGVPSVSCRLNDQGNLELTFDRAVSKGTGSISLQYDHDKTGNAFRVPVVLSSQEYKELLLVTTEVSYTENGQQKRNTVQSIIQSAYAEGMNGALYTANGFEFDTTTKYILGYDKSNTDPALVAAFKGAGKDRLVIPLIADQIKKDTAVADGTTWIVSFTGAYQFPVKGADYTLVIPAGTFTDNVKNVNAEYTAPISAPGVEMPQFRLQTSAATITGAGNTKTASTSMAAVQTATVKMDCRTPGADIWYGLNTQSLNSFTINSCPSSVSTTERFIKKADGEGTKYTREITLGSNQATDTYTAAAGYRFGISAVAKKGNDTSGVAYEYAARTVLKLNINGNYGNGSDNYDAATDIEEGNTTLTMRDLKVWVMGGDSSFGPNSLDSTPLSWMDASKFKLMGGDHTKRNGAYTNNMYGQWYWVTWDVMAPTYIGFVVGNVPSATEGPSIWYAATYHWVPLKSQYKLFPGDTLIMSVDANSSSLVGQKFLFDKGLKGSR